MKKLLIAFFLIGFVIQLSSISAKSLYSPKSYKSGKRITIKDKVQRRRITLLEKELMTSKDAKKTNFNGRTVVKRNVFKCSRNNKSLMLKGNAPFGSDGQRVNLHHLKQQKDGNLIELTHTEHNNHSKVLHRYVRSGSDITDRNSNFASFRKKYWKSRAADCIYRRR